MNGDGCARCHWGRTDALLQAYHDTEWGVPEHDSRALWEKLMLDGFQAGLSWRLILGRRAAFRVAFAGFRPEIVAGYGEGEVGQLLANPGIIRSSAKIGAVIRNARAYLAMHEAGEDFAGFVWGTVGGATGHGRWIRHINALQNRRCVICGVEKARFQLCGAGHRACMGASLWSDQ